MKSQSLEFAVIAVVLAAALSANIGEAFATFGITEEGGGGERWTQREMG